MVVVVEPDRAHATRELLGAAAASHRPRRRGHRRPPDVRALVVVGRRRDRAPRRRQRRRGRRERGRVDASSRPNRGPCSSSRSTAWGREVAPARRGALDAGLTGDAVELDVDDDRLVAWKPAFGGQLVAAISCTSPIQMATVRAGVLPTLTPRPRRHRDPRRSPSTPAAASASSPARATTTSTCSPRRTPSSASARASRPTSTPQLEPLRARARRRARRDAQGHRQGMAAPRSRQIGITGRAIAPRLFVSIGASGKFNHTCRRARRAAPCSRSIPIPTRRSARRRHRHRGRLARSRSAPGRATAVGQRRYAPMRRRMSARSSLFATLPPAEAGSASTTTRCSGNVSLL